jgi:hypothetical protein
MEGGSVATGSDREEGTGIDVAFAFEFEFAVEVAGAVEGGLEVEFCAHKFTSLVKLISECFGTKFSFIAWSSSKLDADSEEKEASA